MLNEETKYKHLNYRERTIIAHTLSNRASFTTITKTLGRNKNAISREVRKNY